MLSQVRFFMIDLKIQFGSQKHGFENKLGFVSINKLGFVSLNKLNFHLSHIVLLIFLLIDLPNSSKVLQGFKESIWIDELSLFFFM